MKGIIIVDFGSQTTKLIAKQIRKLNVFCEIIPYHKFDNCNLEYQGIILSGSPGYINDLNKSEYLKLKEFWTPREILIINNLFLELENNRQKNEEDSNFNNQQNTLIKAIETLLSNKEDAVSKLLFETTTYLE